ncbi:MAG TPA: SIS domain-containing protein [Roseiflexaceae bacterium]|nr:SIS domain-containing protein [Roseiflexaceae bacterium]
MHESTLAHEIHEQPAAIERLLAAEAGAVADLARTLAQQQIRGVLIAARGTSDNAARYAQYLFGTALGLPVALAAPSLHTLYHAPMRYEHMLVIGISQSGQSPDICAVVADARAHGSPTLAITNIATSPLAAAAAHTIELHAGVERSIAATKTYTTQLAALALLVLSLAEDTAGLAELQRIPAAVAATLALDAQVAEVAAAEAGMLAGVTLGRGYNYATAWEIALKLKELTYVPIEAYSAADFQHGPIALVREDFPILAVVPQGAAAADMQALVERLHGLGARLIAISDRAEVLGLADHPLALPQPVAERFSPLTTIVAGQLFAMHLARARGLDPDAPRGLRKVTETR